jgi:hypothetical protein
MGSPGKDGGYFPMRIITCNVNGSREGHAHRRPDRYPRSGEEAEEGLHLRGEVFSGHAPVMIEYDYEL